MRSSPWIQSSVDCLGKDDRQVTSKHGVKYISPSHNDQIRGPKFCNHFQASPFQTPSRIILRSGESPILAKLHPTLVLGERQNGPNPRSLQQRKFEKLSWVFPAEKYRICGHGTDRLLAHHMESLKTQDESMKAIMARKSKLRAYFTGQIEQNLFPGATRLPLDDILMLLLVLISNLQREISILQHDSKNRMARNDKPDEVLSFKDQEVGRVHLEIDRLDGIILEPSLGQDVSSSMDSVGT